MVIVVNIHPPVMAGFHYYIRRIKMTKITDGNLGDSVTRLYFYVPQKSGGGGLFNANRKIG